MKLTAFASHVNEISRRVKEAALQLCLEVGRPVQYLQSSKDDKEEMARAIARKNGISLGELHNLSTFAIHPAFVSFRPASVSA